MRRGDGQPHDLCVCVCVCLSRRCLQRRRRATINLSTTTYHYHYYHYYYYIWMDGMQRIGKDRKRACCAEALVIRTSIGAEKVAAVSPLLLTTPPPQNIPRAVLYSRRTVILQSGSDVKSGPSTRNRARSRVRVRVCSKRYACPG